MSAVCSHFACSPGELSLCNTVPVPAGDQITKSPASAHTMWSTPAPVLCRRGGQADNFKGFSRKIAFCLSENKLGVLKQQEFSFMMITSQGAEPINHPKSGMNPQSFS